MDSKEYWLKREQEHAKQLRKDVSDKTQEIMIEYKRTLDNIEADINRNFVRYAKDGKMTMADAMKLADKMDVVRFADKAKQYVQEMDNSPQANADLKLYNLKMRVSRLQLLKSEIFLEIDKLAGKVNGETWRHLEKVAKLEYKRQAGILGKFLVFDDRKVNALVNASYKLNNGFVTFSNNVWHNTEMLKARLGNALNSAILQGKNPNEYISEFVKIFNAQPYQVGRLLITETARVQGDVQLDSYKQGEIEWYDISYESSACRICRRAAAGGPYRFDRAVVGHNMYPFHPNCLCSIMPAEEPVGASKHRKQDKKKSGKDYIDDLMNTIDLKTASPNDIIKLGKAFNDHYNVTDNIGDKDKLKEFFSNYRQMGGIVPKEMWAKGSSVVVKKQLSDAFSYYPKDWVDYVANSGKKILARRNLERGFFVNGAYKANGKGYATKYENYLDGYFTIVSTGVRKTTPFHEIGHMVEYFNSDLVRIEKEWVDKRTEGEKPTRMIDIFPGSKYKPNEFVKKDDFITPYIGKYYSHGAEVFTMGLEGMFEPTDLVKGVGNDGKMVYTRITDDPEFLNLIIGLFLKG
ncbi:minor capsid protein [Ligilactobacillus murinus]|uniref:minor capsid protein n=1 Tax=Ligilactobacillus murinus TaxID=1622 RepID=UPI00096BE34D|nr:minor capsid protein [Ligilactobacillus murinus]